MRLFCTTFFAFLFLVGGVDAGVTIRNASNQKIEVRIETGPKTTIQPKDSAILDTNRSEPTVILFVGGSEKVSTKVRDRAKVKVIYENTVWSIVSD